MRRFSVTFRKAKDLLDKKAIGPVHFEAYTYSPDFYEIEGNSKSHIHVMLGLLGSSERKEKFLLDFVGG
jgi:predicted dehydrogenase